MHNLVAGGDEVEGLEGASLVLEGTWRAPGASDAVPFSVRTSLGNGLLRPIGEVTGEGPVEGALEVTVTRRPATWFDGVDFAAATEDGIARGVLIHVIGGATVESALR